MAQQQLSNLPVAQLCSVRLWTADEGQTRDGVLSSAFSRHGHASLLSIDVIPESEKSLCRAKRDGDQSSPGCALAIPGARNLSYKKRGQRKKEKKKRAKEKKQRKKGRLKAKSDPPQRTRTREWSDPPFGLTLGMRAAPGSPKRASHRPRIGSLHIYSAVLPLCHRSSLLPHHILTPSTNSNSTTNAEYIRLSA